MSKGLFVIATGTDVGKTYVSALILKQMKEQGLCCGYYKPVLSGASLGIPDCEYVIQKSGIKQTFNGCVTYSFEEPLSPHLAADRVGIEIKPKKILEDFNKHKLEYDYLLIEGAGGVTTPLSLDYLLSDLIKEMKVDTLLVADAGLGTINSVLLTCEYAKLKDINISGIVLNNYDVNNYMHKDNKEVIEKLTGVKVLATVKRDDELIDVDNVVNLFGELL